MKKKVVVLYRVVQEWRRPIFNKLSQLDDIDLVLLHGPDFEGSKVVSSTNKTDFRKKRLFSFKLRREGNAGLIAMPISPFLLLHLMREKPDVIITEGTSNLFNAFVAFIYCRFTSAKYIWWSLGKLKGTVYTGARKKLENLIQYIERNSDAIISYSSLGKKYFQSIGVNEEKIFVAVNVVDTDSKYNELNNSYIEKTIFTNKKFDVLFVGALTKQKKIEVLIKAYSLFEKNRVNSCLTIVGDGSEMEKLQQLAYDLGVKSIKFEGKVFDGVYKYFINADVFVLPGLGGLAISESMLYGVPVIASIGDGCENDLITHNVSGIIDEKLDEQSLSVYLQELYNDPEKLEKFKNNAASTIKNKYNVKTYLQQIVAAIQSV